MQPFSLCANDTHHFKHRVFITAAQSGGCPDSAAFAQATNDLDDFGFVQTQADEPALFVEGFTARWIEATEALHRAGTGFETAEFLGFTATGYTVHLTFPGQDVQ